MQAPVFWKAVTVDRSNLLERFLDLLNGQNVPFCLIGGQALNAYVEPVVSLDLDVVVAADRLTELEPLLKESFEVERFPHSLNVSEANSDLRIQIQLDPRYSPFIDRATIREILGIHVPVAQIEDILQRKIWAVQDTTQRGSKRQKDLADIARVLERHPQSRSKVPPDVLARCPEESFVAVSQDLHCSAVSLDGVSRQPQRSPPQPRAPIRFRLT